MGRPRRTRAAVGVVESGNAAVLVTVSVAGELLDRRRIELTTGLPTHPHHHEGSWAVGRYLGTPGARVLPMAEVLALVERVREAALEGARRGLEELAAAVPSPIDRLTLRACPALPPTVEGRIVDHRAQTVADSVMYREALAAAAEARGWAVCWYDRQRVRRDAVAAMGREAGPPWQAAHRLAAAAALAALAARPE